MTETYIVIWRSVLFLWWRCGFRNIVRLNWHTTWTLLSRVLRCCHVCITCALVDLLRVRGWRHSYKLFSTIDLRWRCTCRPFALATTISLIRCLWHLCRAQYRHHSSLLRRWLWSWQIGCRFPYYFSGSEWWGLLSSSCWFTCHRHRGRLNNILACYSRLTFRLAKWLVSGGTSLFTARICCGYSLAHFNF